MQNRLPLTFREFLANEARDGAQRNRRFVPRNFLLDEGVGPERAQVYADFVNGISPLSNRSWHVSHQEYLAERVFVPRASGATDGLAQQAANPETVPDTFRDPNAFTRFGQANANLPLLRVEQTLHVARQAGITESELERLALSIVGGASEDSLEWQQLEAVLSRWQESLQARPVYAGFMEYFADLFAGTAAEDRPEWADELRDLLGLYHLAKGTGIVVFRYLVRDIPKTRGRSGLRPLVAPTVLDQTHSEAFCPSPGNTNCGHAVDLQGRLKAPPAEEILHPWIRFEPRHVFRVGQITRPVP
ncbi:MAG: hypothetical protein KDM81_18965, partial [Verrucomicrobiae bacterium]|nr:hypothetical protein [Verrucomicrobiae bacterium]